MIPDIASLPVPFITAGIAFLLVIYTVLLFWGDQREDLSRIVRTYSGQREQMGHGRAAYIGTVGERLAAPVASALSRAVSAFAPQETRARVAQKLTMAGNPVDVSTFLALRAISLFGIPLIFLFMVVMSGRSWGIQQLMLLAFTIAAGLMLPDLALKLRIAGRQKKIERSIPDAVDLIVACVEAGLSLDGALVKVAERMPGPLGDEISQALHEIRMGRPRRDALKDVAARTGVASLRNISQAIAHAEQMGVSIADVLRMLAEDLRTKRRLRTQEMAQKAPLKMIPVIVFCILPALFVVVLGPAVISLMGLFGQ